MRRSYGRSRWAFCFSLALLLGCPWTPPPVSAAPDPGMLRVFVQPVSVPPTSETEQGAPAGMVAAPSPTPQPDEICPLPEPPPPPPQPDEICPLPGPPPREVPGEASSLRTAGIILTEALREELYRFVRFIPINREDMILALERRLLETH